MNRGKEQLYNYTCNEHSIREINNLQKKIIRKELTLGKNRSVRSYFWQNKSFENLLSGKGNHLGRNLGKIDNLKLFFKEKSFGTYS